MIVRAQERFSNPRISFAIDDAERLSQPTELLLPAEVRIVVAEKNTAA